MLRKDFQLFKTQLWSWPARTKLMKIRGFQKCKIHSCSLTLIPISFSPTYSPYHALVTRYLNNMNHILTIFLAWGSSDSVAKRITRQTSDREDCSSNPPRGECIYSNVKKLGLSGIHTRISCVEARCPNHITNAQEIFQGKKFDGEWFMKLWNWQENRSYKL